MSAVDILRRAPSIGRDVIELLLRPRSFVVRWKGRTEVRASNSEVLGWGISVAALVFAVYAEVHHGQRVADRARNSIGLPISAPIAKPLQDHESPAIAGIRWSFDGGGLGYAFSGGPAADPQTLEVEVGMTRLYFANVVPERFEKLNPLFYTLFVYLGVVCLYPAVLIWNRSVPPTLAFSFMYLFMTTVVCTVAVWNVLTVVTANDLFHLRLFGALFAYFVASLVIGFVFVRCFWVSHRALYDLKRRQLIGSLIVAWVLTGLAAPLAAPIIWLALRFEGWIEALHL